MVRAEGCTRLHSPKTLIIVLAAQLIFLGQIHDFLQMVFYQRHQTSSNKEKATKGATSGAEKLSSLVCTPLEAGWVSLTNAKGMYAPRHLENSLQRLVLYTRPNKRSRRNQVSSPQIWVVEKAQWRKLPGEADLSLDSDSSTPL